MHERGKLIEMSNSLKNMSDLPNAYDGSKFKEKIPFSTNHCLNYVKKERNAGDEILFTVNIPNEHLKSSGTTSKRMDKTAHEGAVAK